MNARSILPLAAERRLALPVLLALSAWTASASAQELGPTEAAQQDVELSEDADAQEEGGPAPWRGSMFTYRNVVGIVGLDPASELTWNPYYAMDFTFLARWWFDDIFNVGARLDVSRELTQPDDTTYANEALVGDLVVSAAASRFYTIPVLGIDLSADLLLTTPTSKISQARTLVFGLGPGVRVGRVFDLGGAGELNLSYHVRFTSLFHRYSTAELETPLIPGCGVASGGCDSYFNTGLRNAQFRVAHGVDVSYDPLDWFGVSVGFEHVIDWLYALDGDDPRMSLETEPNTDQRSRSAFSAELTFTPMPALQIGVGYETVSPQLAPDSTYYNPFYNRYSTLYLDLRLQVEGLVDQLMGEES
jgi:hypothetical protein